MADVPQRLKPPQTPNSLAEMAARAAKRAQSNRPQPPPPPPVPLQTPSVYSGAARAEEQAPGYASQGGGSGLIHLSSLQPVTSNGHALHADLQRMTAPPTAQRTPLESNPFESKGSRGLLIGFIVGLVVIGGGYGLAMKQGVEPVAVGRRLISSIRNWNAPPAAQLSFNDTKSPTTGEGSNPAAKGVEPAAPRGLDPNNLPAVGTPATSPPEPTDVLAQAKGITRQSKAARAAVEAAPPPKPEPVAVQPKPAAKAEPKPEPQAPEPTGLAGAIKRAVGPTETPKPVAAEAPETPAMRGDIPETPPQGAIQGAIGAHRQAARACLEGHDSPSRATILFASTGKVQSVSVAGPAAGTAAEGCIVKTLSKAAVGAFRRPSFSVTTTISPP
jgi:hypothetical protein